MNRAYAKRGAGHKRTAAERRTRTSAPGEGVQPPLDREELLDLMQDSLEGLTVELGLLVASAILEDEVTRLCGRRYERQPGHSHTPSRPPIGAGGNRQRSHDVGGACGKKGHRGAKSSRASGLDRADSHHGQIATRNMVGFLAPLPQPIQALTVFWVRIPPSQT